MVYDEKRSVIAGLFSINHTFNDVTIKDVFEIEVRLWMMSDRNESRRNGHLVG